LFMHNKDTAIPIESAGSPSEFFLIRAHNQLLQPNHIRSYSELISALIEFDSDEKFLDILDVPSWDFTYPRRLTRRLAKRKHRQVFKQRLLELLCHWPQVLDVRFNADVFILLREIKSILQTPGIRQIEKALLVLEKYQFSTLSIKQRWAALCNARHQQQAEQFPIVDILDIVEVYVPPEQPLQLMEQLMWNYQV
jgi:hypothetical protein